MTTARQEKVFHGFACALWRERKRIFIHNWKLTTELCGGLWILRRYLCLSVWNSDGKRSILRADKLQVLSDWRCDEFTAQVQLTVLHNISNKSLASRRKSGEIIKCVFFYYFLWEYLFYGNWQIMKRHQATDSRYVKPQKIFQSSSRVINHSTANKTWWNGRRQTRFCG